MSIIYRWIVDSLHKGPMKHLFMSWRHHIHPNIVGSIESYCVTAWRSSNRWPSLEEIHGNTQLSVLDIAKLRDSLTHVVYFNWHTILNIWGAILIWTANDHKMSTQYIYISLYIYICKLMSHLIYWVYVSSFCCLGWICEKYIGVAMYYITPLSCILQDIFLIQMHYLIHTYI